MTSQDIDPHLCAIVFKLDDSFIVFQLNTFRLPHFLVMKSVLNVPTILTVNWSIEISGKLLILSVWLLCDY